MSAATLELRTGPSCNKRFRPRKDHYWMCFPCWTKNEPDERDRHIQELQDKLALSKAAIDSLWRQIASLRSLQPPVSDFAEMLPRLIQLCHPDKHRGSEAANKATQWLLKVREEVRS